MATTMPLPAGLQSYLANASPAQLGQLIQTLQHKQIEMGARPAQSAFSMSARAGVQAANTSRKPRTKKTKDPAASGAPKRPLNEWMAFRSYYYSSLAPNTQKSISKILTQWWHADPFEVKWAMLAKAYSIVRGTRNKEDVPLDGFFAVCAPMVGIIPPHLYPQMMGWQMGPPSPGDTEKTPQLTRLFVPNPSTLPEQYAATSLCVEDLVQHCCDTGYTISGNGTTTNVTAAGPSSIAVQPFIAPSPSMIMTDSPRDSEETPLSPASEELGRLLSEALSAPVGDIELSNATSAIKDIGSSYPHNNSFDPTLNFDFDYSFNPSSFENGAAWDAFDPALMGGNGDIGGIDWDAFVDENGNAFFA